MKTHQKVFKLVSFFLQYPEEEWFTALPDIKHEIADIDNPVVKTYLTSFITYLESEPFDQLCEKYVKTFDFHGLVTLNLTYTVFKDSRKRGEALVKLRQMFYDSELSAETDELPDYLPMILEFLAMADEKYIHRVLKLHLNSIKKLENDLAENDSPYHFLLKSTTEVSDQILKNAQVS
ncbi:MAG TPA: nitrate reductase molybdenum cofactor assembly chaperone [Bacillota bacterium]|nr:nitrate reductase molybdenum cofactor assembly chaperone [Bacillota bacterium]